MKTWFEDPRQLVDVDQVLNFWPNKAQTPEERVNAASRFIIYATCVIYLTRRDPRIFALGATVLGAIFALHKANLIKETYPMSTEGKECTAPTEDNPMGNILITDYTDAPNRLEACYYATVKSPTSGTITYDSGRSRTALPQFQRKGLDRQFISAPVSKIPGDQTAFAEWLYGSKKGEPTCREDTRLCDPNARGVQLEAFSGSSSDGNIRGGRGGGSVRGGGGTYS